MFKLEAFRAKWGDALLIHYGTKDHPLYALVDGGPAGTWKTTLRIGLDALRPAPDKALSLRWVAVSHVDDDHIVGVLDLFEEWQDARDGGDLTKVIAASASLFHNTPGPAAPQGGIAAVGPTPGPLDERAVLEARMTAVGTQHPVAGIASYKKGNKLAEVAADLPVDRNPPSGLRVLGGDVLHEDVVGPLVVTVVSPTAAILDRLIDEWEAEAGDPQAGPASVEKKIQNLSSIVLLVRSGNKTMLLCGDALDFDVLEGLAALKLWKEGGKPLHVDLLKLPHHGAVANNHQELFDAVKARHYVISANGKFKNPDPPTLDLLVASEKTRDIDIWLTNPKGMGDDSGDVFDQRVAQLRNLIAQPDVTGTITLHLPGKTDRSVVVSLRN